MSKHNINNNYYTAAIKIGFEYSNYSFRESDSQQLLFLTKESGRISEQTFFLYMQFSDSGFTLSDSGIQLATLGRDFEIANATNQGESALILEFTPSQQRIDFSLNVLQDSIPEETEVFRARLLLPGVGPMGTPGFIPYQNDVFSEALIYIEDDDSEYYDIIQIDLIYLSEVVHCSYT